MNALGLYNYLQKESRNRNYVWSKAVFASHVSYIFILLAAEGVCKHPAEPLILDHSRPPVQGLQLWIYILYGTGLYAC